MWKDKKTTAPDPKSKVDSVTDKVDVGNAHNSKASNATSGTMADRALPSTPRTPGLEKSVSTIGKSLNDVVRMEVDARMDEVVRELVDKGIRNRSNDVSVATKRVNNYPTIRELDATLGAIEDELNRNYDSDDEDMSCGHWCEYVIVVVLSSILLIASVVLVLFWCLYYRGGFAWNEKPTVQFNLHPALMVSGFIFFSGFSMLLYRISRCCRRIYVKLLHTLFHTLAIPCVVLGFMAVLDSHNLADPPIPNFYSLHSWMGFVTMGLFALQFVVGFFSFLLLLCCDSATAGFRASLVPVHATFGLTTFMLAIATCLTGLTQKTYFTYGNAYQTLPEEVIIVNALAMVLVALGILVSYAVRREPLRVHSVSYVTERL